MQNANIGVVGLGVMGHSLALNMERNGFTVAGYDLDVKKTQNFLETQAAGKNIIGASSPTELMALLAKPRCILMMVPAGAPVDSVITHLKPYLEAGDILVDGGNSFYLDTERRNQALAAEGFHFVGMGVSGGEEGALLGPSLMPGGEPEAWQALAPVLQAISAKASEDGQPCVAYMGPRGAGHYVKMVHNGIEYGDMQLIAEAYDFMHRGMGLSALEMSKIFAEWNEGSLHSYLIQITSEILAQVDPDTQHPLVDLILDEAQQKGTGKWTTQNALDIGAPTPTLTAAVESRILSALKPQRINASKILRGPQPGADGRQQGRIDSLRDALYISKIVSYAQGMGMLRIASDELKYDLNLVDVAAIWRAGCIIRARMLNDIMDAYRRNPNLINLLVDDNFKEVAASSQGAWRATIRQAVEWGIPIPAMSASLAYYDAYRSAVLPANLTQAQRDFFGAHTYRRVDKEGVFHTQWVVPE